MFTTIHENSCFIKKNWQRPEAHTAYRGSMENNMKSICHFWILGHFSKFSNITSRRITFITCLRKKFAWKTVWNSFKSYTPRKYRKSVRNYKPPFKEKALPVKKKIQSVLKCFLFKLMMTLKNRGRSFDSITLRVWFLFWIEYSKVELTVFRLDILRHI